MILLRRGILLVAAALAVTAHVPAWGQAKAQSNVRMFKCKDAHGRMYYSDKPGAECAQGGVLELNRQGVAVKRPAMDQGKTKTDSKTDKQRLLQERRDKALLATYSSEAQIDEAKQRSLQVPTQAAKTAEKRYNTAQKDLYALKQQAEKYAGQKKPIPPQLIEEVRAKEQETRKLESDVAARKAQIAEISQRFEADKQRFRELTARQAVR